MAEQHKQIAIRPLMYVDEGIAPLVMALNEVGVHTLFSCQGDRTDKNEPRAYVVFAASRRKGFRIIRHLQDCGAPDDIWELNVSNGLYTLFIDPKSIRHMAATLLLHNGSTPDYGLASA